MRGIALSIDKWNGTGTGIKYGLWWEEDELLLCMERRMQPCVVHVDKVLVFGVWTVFSAALRPGTSSHPAIHPSVQVYRPYGFRLGVRWQDSRSSAAMMDDGREPDLDRSLARGLVVVVVPACICSHLSLSVPPLFLSLFLWFPPWHSVV